MHFLSLTLHKHRNIFLTSFAILLLSIILRFWLLGAVPVGLYWDEVAMYVDAKTISQTMKDMHGKSAFQTIFLSYGDYKMPVYIWLASLSFKLFGMSDLTLRLPSALAGIAQGGVVFLLLRELTKENLTKIKSLIVSFTGWFVLAVTPWSILFSRSGFEGHIGQFLLTTSVFALFLSLKSKKWLLLATILGIASVYSYYSVRFVWPVLFCSFIFFFDFPKRLNTSYIKKISLYAFCFLFWGMSILPLFISPKYADSQKFRLSTNSLMDLGPYSIQSNVYREMSGNTVLSRVFYHHRILQLKDILAHYSDHFDFNYLFVSGDPNLRHGTGSHGLFLIFCFPLLIAGTLSLMRKRLNLFLFILLWWLIALLPASIPMETPHALRSLNALTPIILVMAMGAAPVYRLIQNIKSRMIQKVAIFCILSFVAIDVLWFGFDYFFLYPAKSANVWQQGYKDIVINVDDNRDMYNTMWLNPYDDRFFLWYLAYGKVSATEIQKAMENELILKQWKNLEFRQYAWETFPTSVKPFIVVTRESSLQVPPDREKIIYDGFGNPKFNIGFYEKK